MLLNSILQRCRVSTRLLFLCVMALLVLASVGILSLRDLHDSMVEERKAKVRAQVESAVGIVQYFQKQAQSGQLSVKDAQANAAAALRDVRYDGNEYFFIINTDLVYQMHPLKAEFVGQYKGELKDSNGVMILQELLAAARKGGDFTYFHFAKPGEKEPKPKIAYSLLINDWNWIICTGVYEDDIDHAFFNKLMQASIEFCVLSLLLGWIAWVISRSILQQLGGEPQAAMAIMNEVAAGNLHVHIESKHPESMLATLKTMVAGLRSTLQSIQNHAGTLSQQSTQIAHSSKSIAQASAQQADATTSMAAAMEELTVSISQISDNSQISEHASRDATELARNGVTQVRNATEAMAHISHSVSGATQQIQELDSKTRDISGIAAVIKDIAGQTNLLALNAAIEAARAGEEGRGFAVVADEVRKLAERTSNATIDIERMLLAIQGETAQVVGLMQATLPEVDRGVELARHVADSLTQIHQGAESTLAHLQEVASATREQSVASNNIAVRVEDISQMVEETSIAIRHSADSAHGVEQIAAELQEMVRRFRI